MDKPIGTLKTVTVQFTGGITYKRIISGFLAAKVIALIESQEPENSEPEGKPNE